MLFPRNKNKLPNLPAFTLIELLVVISIMAILAAGVIANYAGQRGSRDLKIAANQLVTNIRKAQSYTLTSRELNGTTPVQYYIMRFDTASSSQYEIQGMYNVKTSPVMLRNSETITLPVGVTLAYPTVSVNGTLVSPNPSCVLVAFALPYAKILSNTSCTGAPPTVNANDDYQKIINYVVNNSVSTVDGDSLVTLTLQNKSGTAKVLINGITGVVCPTSNGTTCLTSY